MIKNRLRPVFLFLLFTLPHAVFLTAPQALNIVVMAQQNQA